MTRNTLNPAAITQRQRWNLILILGGLMSMQPFALDPFLPAAPSISATFAVDDTAMRLTIAGLSLGFALGQLIAGPLSDSLGRRRPILVAASAYVLASAIVVTATSFPMFAAGRVLQGVAGAAIQVVANAIMRDLYAGSGLMRLMSRVFLIQALSWFVGPSVGTLLLQAVGWRGMAIAFAGYAVVMMLLAVRALPETLARGDRAARANLLEMAKRFGSVLHDRAYVGIVIVSMLNNVALFGYLSAIPFIYQDAFGLTPSQYGFVLMFNSASAYVGVQVIALIAKRFGIKWTVVGMLSVQIGVGLTLFAMGTQNASWWSVEAALLVYTFLIGGSFAPLGTLALTRHGEEAGTAAALNMVLGSVAAAAAGPAYALIGTADTRDLGLMIAGLFALAVLSMFVIVKVRQLPKI